MYLAGVWVSFLGMYTVLTYIDLAAVQNGLSTNFAFYLVSIANGGSVVGRLGAGTLGDKFGPVTLMITLGVLTAITTFVWPLCVNSAQIVVLAVFYGIFSGGFTGLIIAPLSSIDKSGGDIGQLAGFLLAAGSVASLIGPPIAGAIRDATGGFHAVAYYAGSSILLSSAILLGTRYVAIGGFKGKF